MIRCKILLLFLPAYFLFSTIASGQQAERDTVSTVNKRANKAAVMSALVPGLGQAYNKSYWKIPVLYAGFGTLIYFVNENQKEYTSYKQAYIYRLDGDSTTNDTEYPNLADEDILVRKDFYRRNRDLSYVLIGVVYVLNIVDAYVDAHLKEFDISDDLSLRTSPWLSPSIEGNYAAGVTLTFGFH